jgi:hypothetical protein
LAGALQNMLDVCAQGSKVASLAIVLGVGGAAAETPESLAAQAAAASAAQAQQDRMQLSAGSVVQQPLSAFRAVQSSLRAHMEEANHIALHGEGISLERIDRIMKELMDIEHSSGGRGPLASPTPLATEVRLKALRDAGVPPPSTGFPFLPEEPLDPFSVVGYRASPGDAPPSIQLVPYGSLLSRLVFSLLELSDEGLLTPKTVASMWQEFVHELRFHFETSLPIPRLLSSDTPDFGLSILHQKIQLLQRCIRIKTEKSEHKSRTAAAASGAASVSSSSSAQPSSSADSAAATKGSKSTPDWQHPWNAWSEEKLASAGGGALAAAAPSSSWGSLDDLGFGDEGGSTASPAVTSSSSGWGELDLSVNEVDSDDDDAESAASDARSRQPEGVASEMTGMRLLLVPDAPLRVPETQEVRVMSSDQFDEQNEMFARLGSGPEAQRLRTEMQTASLASDMSAFKAANPGCILEDFVRWHSPKDWRAAPVAAADANVDAHAKRGELSQRMRKRSSADNHNIWHSLWKAAKPVPAAAQTPLFDPSLEGEHALSWLENVEPSLLFSHLQGIALQNAIGLLARTRGLGDPLPLPPMVSALHKLHHYLKNYNRNTASDLYADFAACEMLAAKATSLLLCLPPPPQPTAAGAKSSAPGDASSSHATHEMLTHLLHSGSYLVGSSGPERTALTNLLSGASPRSKPPSLFRAVPFSYNNNGGNARAAGGSMDAVGSGPTLPPPDWSEHTFFAPHPPSVVGGSSSGAASSSGPILVGSRTYICQRHSMVQGAHAPAHKVRICTSMLLQTA